MSNEHANKETKNKAIKPERIDDQQFQIETPFPTQPLTPADILSLQRSIGNRAVQRLMAGESVGGAVRHSKTSLHAQEAKSTPETQREDEIEGEDTVVEALPRKDETFQANGSVTATQLSNPLVQRAPPTAPPAPTAPGSLKLPNTVGHAIVFEHEQLSEEKQETQTLLKQMIMEKGWDTTRLWAYRFINADPVGDLALGSGDTALVGRIRASFRPEVEAIDTSIKQLTDENNGTFSKKAHEVTIELLDKSEKNVRDEAKRYGLKVEGLIFKDYSTTAGGSLQASIQAAARELAGLRRNSDLALEGFKKAKDNPFMPDFAEASRKAWIAQEDKYHEQAKAKEKEYPILAAYSSVDDAADRLEELASRNTDQFAESLYKTVDDRLSNIAKVREEIGGRYNIWKQPQIIALTKTAFGTLEPWQSRVVDDKAKEVKAQAAEDAKVYAAIALGLGLLAAIPTGGTSLLAGAAAAGAVMAVGYSVYTLYQHYKDYDLAKAETGTNFDKAKSISVDEPGLSWLALDLLDLGLNLVGAKAAFVALREAMLAAQASKLARLPEAIEAAEKYGLSAEGRSRYIATVVEKSGGEANVQEVLKKIMETYDRLLPGKDAAFTKAMQEAAERVMQERRVAILNQVHDINDIKEVLKARGVPEAELDAEARALAKKFVNPETMGNYNAKYDVIILRNGNAMPEFLAHELAHRAQQIKGELATMGTMRQEFHAYKAQKQFLLHLPPDDVPAGSRYLLTHSDAEIRMDIAELYKDKLAAETNVVKAFNSNAETQYIIDLIKDLASKGKL